jgi:histidinol-phosphate aminotransferase
MADGAILSPLLPVHGGTDAGPEPRWDFSTNANPLGACPAVLEAVRAADITRYPDPRYVALRAALAAHHATDPACIVIGTGVSELILRLVRACPGPVLTLRPTFSEYERCARIEGRTVLEAATPAAFLQHQLDIHGWDSGYPQNQFPDARGNDTAGRGLGFVCWPNNPTGECPDLDFLAEAAARGPLAVDLAYAPLCPRPMLDAVEAAAARAIRLYAPNKAFGLTGLRAGYAVTPYPWPELEQCAASWPVGPDGVAFLHGTISPPALAWLETSRSVLADWRQALAAGLADLGCAVRESPASFLMAEVGDAAAVAAALRRHGLRVRDGSSFGLPGWIRLRAAPPEPRAALLAVLKTELRR